MKRCHNAAMSRYFKGGKDKHAAETELALLEKALNTFDFALLRGQWSFLSGGDKRPVFLIKDDYGNLCLQSDNQCIVPPAKEECFHKSPPACDPIAGNAPRQSDP